MAATANTYDLLDENGTFNGNITYTIEKNGIIYLETKLQESRETQESPAP